MITEEQKGFTKKSPAGTGLIKLLGCVFQFLKKQSKN